MASATSRCASGCGRPVAFQYNSRLARPDRCGRKPEPSTKLPIRERISAPGRTWWPNTLISPEVGVIKPITIRNVVVLPAPFGPSRPSTMPGSTSNETSVTAFTPPG